MRKLFNSVWVLVFAGVLAACSDSGSGTEVRDNSEEVAAFYTANPEKFSFRTLADIPADLVWENGMEQPDIGSPDAKKGGTMFDYMPDFPRTLRTVGPDSGNAFRRFIYDNVTLGLAGEHPNTFEYYPELATEWAISPETRTVYARIHPDAKWSDGEAITVDDYFFTFYFNMSEHIVDPWYNNFYETRFTNITKYDDHTLSITMAAAKPDMASYALGLRPTPQHFYREFGDDFIDRYQWQFPPTTGPYVINDGDLVMGRSIAFTRNDGWWARDNKFLRYRFNPDRIQLSVIRDPNNQIEAFRRGDTDQIIVNTMEVWYDQLPDSSAEVANGYIHKSQFHNRRPRSSWGLWINSAQPVLEDVNVRLGIQHASNWDLVIERYFRGDYTRLNTSRDGFGEFSHPTITARQYDIDLAMEHFALAGFERRGADGILVNAGGQRLAFTLTTPYERFRDLLPILREEALKAGLELRLEVLDFTTGIKKLDEKQHDIGFVSYGVGAEMYPRFWEYYHSSNAFDNAFLEDGSVNPARQTKSNTNNLESIAIYEMDQMIEQFDASSDAEEMKALSHRLIQMHHDYASFVPGYAQDFFRVAHWRWVRYPADFNVARADGTNFDYFVYWIDEAMKQETLAARRSGQTFEPQIRVYNQYRELQ
ncbi:MAG: extracellular solute-binding protein [Pseudohongiella sp.]|nr:extracellular solute-binding protein [Pseudohongiella sp.]